MRQTPNPASQSASPLARSGVISFFIISTFLFLFWPMRIWADPQEARAASENSALAPPFHVALRTFGVWRETSKERIDLSVWYPGGSGRGSVQIEGHIIQAVRNGRPVAGFFPIILMSHDSTGSRFANHDMARQLAENGFVVIAPTHTGDSIYDSSDLFTAENIIERPRDLLVSLEVVLDSPELSGIADESRIGVMGSGFGAITAMQMAGARPDFSEISLLCRESGNEPLCAPWSRERLKKIPGALAAYEQSMGSAASCPGLAYYAPTLIAAPADEKYGASDEYAKDLFEIIFPPASTATSATPADDRNDIASISTQGQVDYILLFSSFSFQPGNLAGDPKKAAAYRPPLKSQDKRKEEAENAHAKKRNAGKPAPKKARHRPADIRSLKAIALLNPAGGRFFSKESLSGLRQPIAIVQSENDEIYPVKTHAAPYLDNLPTQPSILSVENSDHYSLFAPCPEHVSGMLEQNCGKADPDERHDMAEKRDHFIVAFFKSTLGAPSPMPPETNLVAADPHASEQRTD